MEDLRSLTVIKMGPHQNFIKRKRFHLVRPVSQLKTLRQKLSASRVHQHRTSCWKPTAPSVHWPSWSSSKFLCCQNHDSRQGAHQRQNSLPGASWGERWGCTGPAHFARPPILPSCLTHPVAAAMMHPPSAALAEQQSAESWLIPKLWPISWAMVAATPMAFSEWSCMGREFRSGRQVLRPHPYPLFS